MPRETQGYRDSAECGILWLIYVSTLADGSAKSVPVIAPITIEFENRWYTTEALVLGDETLMVCIPIEAMDVRLTPEHSG